MSLVIRDAQIELLRERALAPYLESTTRWAREGYPAWVSGMRPAQLESIVKSVVTLAIEHGIDAVDDWCRLIAAIAHVEAHDEKDIARLLRPIRAIGVSPAIRVGRVVEHAKLERIQARHRSAGDGT